jgi:SAM-dependent methyltransferase
MPTPPTVYIITWCRSEELLYGSTLTFKTLRTGFPDSEVVVIENASPPELRAQIVAAAEAVGCSVRLNDNEKPHWAHLEELTLAADGPTVFLDPDLVFWERIDHWTFGDALMAGRYLPEFADPFSDTLTLSRLHTSHLWFPDPARLRQRIADIQRTHFQAGSLFESKMLPPGWWRWDTAAVLFHALGGGAARFTESELDAYDHLFCGSHLPMVASRLGPWGGLMIESHQRAQTDLPSIKGIWRQQEAFFSSRPWSGQVSA